MSANSVTIDLNADLGEGLDEADEGLLSFVTSANIACGGHAGDTKTMRRIVRRCHSLGLRIGGHPSYPDRPNFGRFSMDLDSATLIEELSQQLNELMSIAKGFGAVLSHLKPHGALYHDAATDGRAASALIMCAKRFGLDIMGLADSPLEDLVRGDSIGYIREGFADRRYLPSGGLVPRSQQEAVIEDPEEAASQAVRLAPRVDSICIHSDTAGAVKIAASVRKRLIEDGWQIGS